MVTFSQFSIKVQNLLNIFFFLGPHGQFGLHAPHLAAPDSPLVTGSATTPCHCMVDKYALVVHWNHKSATQGHARVTKYIIFPIIYNNIINSSSSWWLDGVVTLVRMYSDMRHRI